MIVLTTHNLPLPQRRYDNDAWLIIIILYFILSCSFVEDEAVARDYKFNEFIYFRRSKYSIDVTRLKLTVPQLWCQ